MKTRQKILTAATTVFYNKGFHAARMDEIAAKAGVAKGSLYYNFPSKSRLFAATVIEGMENIQSHITQDLNSELPFIDHFHLLVEKLITLYLKHRELTNIAFNELSNGIDQQVLEDIRQVRNSFISFVSDILKKGQGLGYLKALDVRLSARILVGIVDTVCTHDVDAIQPSEIRKIVDTVFTILSTGLLNPEK